MAVLRKPCSGSRRNIGRWEKPCFFFLKTVFVALAQILDLPRFTFSVMLFVVFFFNRNEQNLPLCSPAAITKRWRRDDPHGPFTIPGAWIPGTDLWCTASRSQRAGALLRKPHAMGLLKLKTHGRQQEVDCVLYCVCVMSKGSRKRPSPWLPCLLTVCSLTELLSASVSSPATWGIVSTCFISLGSYNKTP